MERVIVILSRCRHCRLRIALLLPRALSLSGCSETSTGRDRQRYWQRAIAYYGRQGTAAVCERRVERST